MSFTHSFTALLISLMATLTACSTGGGTQEPVPVGRPPSSASVDSLNASDAVACAYNATPFSPTTKATAHARLELEHYDDCAMDTPDRAAAHHSDDPHQGSLDIFAFEAGGYWIGNAPGGTSLTYTISVPKAGFYDLALRVRPPSPLSAADALITLAASGRGLPATELAISAQTEATWGDIILPLRYFKEGLQQLHITVIEGDVDLDYLDWRYAEDNPSPADTVANMGIGINLGNTLDAPEEGKWAPAAERHFFEDFAEAGFGHVRIPVTWDKHVSTSPPYTIDPVFLARVEQVVDWGLTQGLFVILNAHHETWLKEHYSDADTRTRFAAIWRQVATHMQQKPARLIFEILNEPVGMRTHEVDELNSSILTILRESNPTRLVVFSGTGFTSMDSLAAAAVPDDTYLIGNFHNYDPWAFAGQCVRSWGSTDDQAQLAATYQKAADWAERTGIPVMVNEFGAAHYNFRLPQNVCDPKARLTYLSAHAEQARKQGIAATVWDDSGSFQIYRRQQRAWGEEKAALLDHR